jgi:hypothetical protein
LSALSKEAMTINSTVGAESNLVKDANTDSDDSPFIFFDDGRRRLNPSFMIVDSTLALPHTGSILGQEVRRMYVTKAGRGAEDFAPTILTKTSPRSAVSCILASSFKS